MIDRQTVHIDDFAAVSEDDYPLSLPLQRLWGSPDRPRDSPAAGG